MNSPAMKSLHSTAADKRRLTVKTVGQSSSTVPVNDIASQLFPSNDSATVSFFLLYCLLFHFFFRQETNNDLDQLTDVTDLKRQLMLERVTHEQMMTQVINLLHITLYFSKCNLA